MTIRQYTVDCEFLVFNYDFRSFFDVWIAYVRYGTNDSREFIRFFFVFLLSGLKTFSLDNAVRGFRLVGRPRSVL